MFGFYILSFLAGLALGGVHAFVFFRETGRTIGQQLPGGARALMSGVGSFFMRYVLLFVALYLLFFKQQLNIYLGLTGFFVAFWGVILIKMRGTRGN